MYRRNVNIRKVLPGVVIGTPFSCPSFRKRGRAHRWGSRKSCHFADKQTMKYTVLFSDLYGMGTKRRLENQEMWKKGDSFKTGGKG
jgi:hypothetical protein